MYYTADYLPRSIQLALALTNNIGGRMEIITTYLGASPIIFHSIMISFLFKLCTFYFKTHLGLQFLICFYLIRYMECILNV